MSLADLEPERPNMDFPILSEEDAQTYKSMSTLAESFYKAKWDHYVDRTLSRLKFRSREYDREIAEEVEKDMKERVELMYSFDDIRNDRYILRDRFLHEMNKKTTLKDIGAKLDEFILDSKANMG
jgi:small subunit ribosomal protein S9